MTNTSNVDLLLCLGIVVGFIILFYIAFLGFCEFLGWLEDEVL
jgi:hypothetical protein